LPDIKLDLHIHTIYSKDSLIKPLEIPKYIKMRDLDGIAITDHGNLQAYHKLKKQLKNDDIILIPGMEIETHIGEVIGLFIKKEIDTRDNNFFTIVKKIKKNDGLVIIPHPFDFLRRNHLKMDLITKELSEKYIDGIEIMNSRIVLKYCIKKAKRFNLKHQLFETGGSDAHTAKEIGKGYTLINDISDVSLESIKQALLSKKSISKGKLSSPFVHVTTIINKFKKGLYF
jgi:predicted metal-dependent phosphoesterase TrpH